jgi:flagellar motor component MotA
MTNTSIIIIAVITAILIGAIIAIYIYKKKNVVKLFEQVYETAKQVPKQKKNSFILLLFIETLSESSKKGKSSISISKLNNPKYLDIQLVRMSKILKDSSNVKDKYTKQSLSLLKDYVKWEAEKNLASKKKTA